MAHPHLEVVFINSNPESSNQKIHPLYNITPPGEFKSKDLPSVDIVLPVHNNQDKLDLVLTALSKLNYPSQKIKVFILDDGSNPKINLKIKLPFKTKVLYREANSKGWGKASLVNFYLKEFKSQNIWFLDSDILVQEDHLLWLTRYQNINNKSIVLGFKRFTTNFEITLKNLNQVLDNKEFDSLFPDSYPHDYWEELVTQSNYCQDLNFDIFKIMVGATFLINRKDFIELGGYQEITTGEDTVFGYRAFTQGFSFIPVAEAKSYHLGATTMQKNQEIMLNHNMAILADYIPTLTHYRALPYINYSTPYTVIHYQYSNETFERFVKNLKSFATLSPSFLIDFPIDLTTLKAKYNVVDDPYADLRKIYNYYKSSPQVRFVPLMSKSIDSILKEYAQTYASAILIIDGDTELLVDLKKINAYLKTTPLVAIAGIDNKDSKLIFSTPNLLNRHGIDAGNVYYQLIDDELFQWLPLENLALKVNKKKAYWKFIKYLFRRVKTIRNLTDAKNMISKAKVILKNYLIK